MQIRELLKIINYNIKYILEQTTDLIINFIKKANLMIAPENTSLFTLDRRGLLEKVDSMNNNFFDLKSIGSISNIYKKINQI
jgi:hypothetical protein